MQKGKKGKRERVAGMAGWRLPAFGVFVSVGVAIMLLGVCAMLIGMGVIPERAGKGSVLIACALGCFAGGRVTVCDKSGGALLWGMVTGTLVAMALGVSGILLYGMLDVERCASIYGACLCGGGLAGAIGGKKRRR